MGTLDMGGTAAYDATREVSAMQRFNVSTKRMTLAAAMSIVALAPSIGRLEIEALPPSLELPSGCQPGCIVAASSGRLFLAR
jgi:hypothetical protein